MGKELALDACAVLQVKRWRRGTRGRGSGASGEHSASLVESEGGFGMDRDGAASMLFWIVKQFGSD